MSSSATYTFGDNTQLDDLIRESYERIGMIGNVETPLNLQSAILSGNIELASWPGRGLNLWMIQRMMIGLNPGQAIYQLPNQTVRVLEVTASSPFATAALGGTSSGGPNTQAGHTDNCFNQSSTEGWTSGGPYTSVKPYIRWDFGTAVLPQSIMYVGITPLTNGPSLNYQLAFQYAQGDLDNTASWTTLFTTQLMDFPAKQTQWFVLENTVNARAWQIVWVAGSTVDLALQSVYFSIPPTYGNQDRILAPISRAQWMAIPRKLQGLNTTAPTVTNPNPTPPVVTTSGGFPSGYYFNQSMPQTLILWPVSVDQYTTLLYTNYHYVQDFTALFNTVNVPARFYDALCSGLAYRLACKFAPDKAPMLQDLAKTAYAIGAQTDYENVPVMITPDFTAYMR